MLVVWNLIGEAARWAGVYRRAGAKVIVAENGYCGLDHAGHHLFALARDGHNGSGRWHIGEQDRFAQLDLAVEPWRESGDHVVVVGQRGIGAPGMASPRNFLEATCARLAVATRRRLVRYPHPGKPACRIAAQFRKVLAGAHACVVWSSSNGVTALLAGIPVITLAPHWIARDAAGHHVSEIEAPPKPDRMPILRRLAWAQWTAAEVESGEPFTRLLEI